MLRTVLLILSGNAFTAAMTLIRNLVIARLVGIEDYGVASTFAVTMAVVEMMTSFGLNQLIVQMKDGDNPKVQAALQGFHLLRSFVAAAVLYSAAGAIARYLDIEYAKWAYQALAIIPLANGFAHYDVFRLERNMKFLPQVLSTALPAFVAVIAIWPLYYIFQDYRVMLISVLIQGVGINIASHLVAERPYRLTLDPTIMASAMKFGWPILLNNILMLAVFHGDRIIVGGAMGIEKFALISLGYTLTLSPTQLVARTTQKFFLPQLSALKEDNEGFETMSLVIYECQILLASMFAVFIAFFAPLIIISLVSLKYVDVIPILTWLAVLNGLWLVKIASSTIAVARAKTENALVANIVRAAFLPLIIYAARNDYSLVNLVQIGVVAETLSLLTSMVLVKFRIKISLRKIVPNLLIGALVFTAAIFYASSYDSAKIFYFGNPYYLLISIMLLLALLLRSRSLQVYLKNRKMISNT